MPDRITFKDRSQSDDLTDEGIKFEFNLFAMTRHLLTRKKIISGFTFGVMLVYTVYLFLQPNLYTSTSTILPSGKSSNMSALRNLIGMGGPSLTTDENSSTLYPVILESNHVVDAVADKTYALSNKGNEISLTLGEYFGQDNRDWLRRAIRSATTLNDNAKTGAITVAFESKYPQLSQQVVAAYIKQLEDFNLNKRQSSARNNEKYLRRQVTESRSDLATAEDSLEAFQMVNLDWAATTSPEVQKELTRLQREVEAKSSTYLMLVQQYELAAIEAQKDVPVVSVLDTPSLPVVKSGPFRRNLIIMAGIIAFFLSSAAVILKRLILENIDRGSRVEFDRMRRDLTDNFPRTNRIIEKIKTLTH